MHSNMDAFPTLLARPWLRMADAIMDWEGAKPSITYGPKDIRVKVYIGSLGHWVKEEITPSLDEGEGENEGKNTSKRHWWGWSIQVDVKLHQTLS